MKCHYEVLDLPHDADDSQIKSSYRKLALKWHPDKNLDNPEAAKEQFQLVQQAYEILSDHQERAWYDKHREQILNGSKEDNCLDVFQYFTTTCFKGYNDSENGFYTVYRKVFDLIAQEDMEFMAKSEYLLIPSFGSSTSDYEEVVGPFYSYWISYSTKKSYVWLDPYNIKETRERRMFKLVEKENKKVRSKAKKERNEEVRNLVAFVRKRDKRVQEYSKILEARAVENRKKQEIFSKQQKLERIKELNSSGNQAEWMKFENVQSELEQIEKSLAAEFGEELSDYSDQQSEDEVDILYCAACNKSFKTSKAFENHESSKKHKENVSFLKTTLEQEDEILNGDDSDLENSLDTLEDEEASDSRSPTPEETKPTNKKKKTKKNKKVLPTNESDLEDVKSNKSNTEDPGNNESIAETSQPENRKPKKKAKKPKNPPKTNETDHETIEPIPPSFDLNGSDVDFVVDGALKNKSAKSKKANKKSLGLSNGTVDPQVNGFTSSKKKKPKKWEDNNDNEVNVDISHCCVMCKADFPSKNKLFDHLKKTGHSVYLPELQKTANVKKKNAREK